MKRWLAIILCIGFVIPTTVQTSIYDDETQTECERRTIAAVYRYKFSLYDGDIFNWEDFVNVASKMFNSSLEKYPESMELNERLQDLTSERIRNPDIPEDEKQAIKDSFTTYYRTLYEENPKTVLNIYLYSRTLHDPNEHLRLAKEMLKVDKNSYWANEAMGWSYKGLKEYGKAEKYLKKAIEIDSTKFDAYSALAEIYYIDSRYEDAFPLALKGYELSLHHQIGRGCYGLASVTANELKDKELQIEVEKALLRKIPPEAGVLGSYRNHCEEISKAYRVLEESDSALRYIDLAQAFCEFSDVSWAKASLLYEKACYEAWQGNNEEALDLLEQAYKQGCRLYADIETNQDFEPLKEEQRFKNLITSMKEETKKVALSNPINESAPDFTLVSTEGDTVTLSDLRGNIVVLDFWFMCCISPGAYTMRILDKYNEEHPGEVIIYGMGCDIADVGQVDEVMRNQWKVELPNLVCTPEIKEAYGIEGTPHILVIDKNGNMTYSFTGYHKNQKGFTKQMHDMLDWWLEELNQ